MAEDGAVAAMGDTKRQRTAAHMAMPQHLRQQIENSLAETGEVEHRKRSHHSTGPVTPRVQPPEDLVH